MQKSLGYFLVEAQHWFSSALLCNRAMEQDEDLSPFAYSHIITETVDGVTLLQFLTLIIHMKWLMI